jgi:hypothetical protein
MRGEMLTWEEQMALLTAARQKAVSDFDHEPVPRGALTDRPSSQQRSMNEMPGLFTSPPRPSTTGNAFDSQSDTSDIWWASSTSRNISPRTRGLMDELDGMPQHVARPPLPTLSGAESWYGGLPRPSTGRSLYSQSDTWSRPSTVSSSVVLRPGPYQRPVRPSRRARFVSPPPASRRHWLSPQMEIRARGGANPPGW